MDKISKALKKFTDREKVLVKGILVKIKKGSLESLQVNKLKGYDDIFRVKKGRLRVIYRMNGEKINLLTIEKRSDNTYKKF